MKLDHVSRDHRHAGGGHRSRRIRSLSLPERVRRPELRRRHRLCGVCTRTVALLFHDTTEARTASVSAPPPPKWPSRATLLRPPSAISAGMAAEIAVRNLDRAGTSDAADGFRAAAPAMSIAGAFRCAPHGASAEVAAAAPRAADGRQPRPGMRARHRRLSLRLPIDHIPQSCSAAAPSAALRLADGCGRPLHARLRTNSPRSSARAVTEDRAGTGPGRRSMPRLGLHDPPGASRGARPRRGETWSNVDDLLADRVAGGRAPRCRAFRLAGLRPRAARSSGYRGFGVCFRVTSTASDSDCARCADPPTQGL